MKIKKMIVAATIFCAMLIPFGSSNAVYFPQYLYGNSDLVLAYGHMGYGQYVDKSSVVCQVYNPPYYRLAANVVSYNCMEDYESAITTQYFDYHTDTGAIYQITPNRTYGPYYDRRSNPSSKSRPVSVAKIIWKTAYNMDWKW